MRNSTAPLAEVLRDLPGQLALLQMPFEGLVGPADAVLAVAHVVVRLGDAHPHGEPQGQEAAPSSMLRPTRSDGVR